MSPQIWQNEICDMVQKEAAVKDNTATTAAQGGNLDFIWRSLAGAEPMISNGDPH